MPRQDICPICAQEIKKGEAVVKYRSWGDQKSVFVHIDCALYVSETEKRKHPPSAKRTSKKSKTDH